MKNPYISSIVLAAMAVAFPVASVAAPVSPEKAVAIAMQARNASSGTAAKVPSSLKPSIVFQRPAGRLDAAVYAVSYGEDAGFAIVAGDTKAPSVLGYSPEGTLDVNNLPPALDALMQDYAVAVAAAAEADGDEYVPVRIEGRKEILPLITATWNQNFPYNVYCPKTGSERAPVGCVAISVGQTMHHHQWPPKSRGIVTYEAGRYKLGTEYDWASMPNSLVDTPQEVYDNPAKMLYELGRALFMSYTGTASGTFSYLIPETLITNFSYDTSIDYASRNFFSDSQWEEMIYSQLACGQPVVYDGLAVSEGHSFACDGYDGKGYFHINWGWEGKSNGYFLLSHLDPEEQGIGGAASGFFRRHGAVLNIRPPKGGVQPERLTMNGSLTQGEIPNTFRIADYDFDGWGHDPGVFNYTGRDFNAALGMRIMNVENPADITYVYDASRNWIRWSSRSPYFTVDFASMPDGRYYLYPVFKDEYGLVQEVDAPVSASRVLEVVVENGAVSTFAPASRKEGVAPTGIYAEESDALQLQPGFMGRLCAYMQPLDADAEIEWSSADNDIAVVHDGLVITRGKLGAVEVTASVKGHPEMKRTFIVNVEAPAIIDNLSFDREKMQVLMDSENQLPVIIAPEKVSNSRLVYKSSNPEIASVDCLGVLKAGSKKGEVTVTAETLDGSELKAELLVEVTDEAGVEGIADSTVAAPSPVYTVTGIRVAEAENAYELEALPAGLYIWRGEKHLIREK